jgi:hypothetical protein
MTTQFTARLRRRAGAVQRKWKRSTSPFAGPDRWLLVHAGHHKCGTVWFKRILTSLAADLGMRIEVGKVERNEVDRAPTGPADIFFQPNSLLDREALGAFRGTHFVRDPRDIVVSGYLYHLWTDEAWAHVPHDRFGGLSYQEYLNSLDQDRGLSAEIERAAAQFAHMAAWEYDDPRFLELRFEDLRSEGSSAFERIFRHYDFSDAAVERGLYWVEYHSWENTKAREVKRGQTGSSHLRSRTSGEWRHTLSAEHLARIEELAGPLIRRLGYS